MTGPKGTIERIDLKGLRNFLLKFMPLDMLSVEGDTKCPDVGFIPIFAAIAVYYGESANITEASIGYTKEQMSLGRVNFLNGIGPTFASYQSGLPTVRLTAPYSDKTKADVIQHGHALGLDFKKTWSCSFGGTRHCGVCPTCDLRKEGFVAAGVPDPTDYVV